MLLYKFRPMSRLDFVLDIVINETLFCATPGDLNDPFEGQCLSHFGSKSRKDTTGFLSGNSHPVADSVPLESFVMSNSYDNLFPQARPRVCSLSAAIDDVRMWSLYADSHRGLAIGIELENEFPNLRQVRYEKGLAAVDHGPSGLLATPDTDFDGACGLLTRKTDHWYYEQEWRVFSDADRVGVGGRVRSVVFGARTELNQRKLIMKLAPKIEYRIAVLDPSAASVLSVQLDENGERAPLVELARAFNL